MVVVAGGVVDVVVTTGVVVVVASNETLQTVKSSVTVKVHQTADRLFVIKPGSVQYCRRQSDTL